MLLRKFCRTSYLFPPDIRERNCQKLALYMAKPSFQGKLGVPGGWEWLPGISRSSLGWGWGPPALFNSKGGFPGGSAVKSLSAVQETRVPSLGGEDPLEKEMAAHCSILAWRIPRTEEPDGLQSTGSQSPDTTAPRTLSVHLSQREGCNSILV